MALIFHEAAMPHCVLEFSANVPDQVNFPEFFGKMHAVLSASGDINQARLKSRWIKHEHYYVADGAPQRSFVYLQIALLSGRSEELRKELGRKAFEVLKEYFPVSSQSASCSMTLEMREMLDETHFKN